MPSTDPGFNLFRHNQLSWTVCVILFFFKLLLNSKRCFVTWPAKPESVILSIKTGCNLPDQQVVCGLLHTLFCHILLYGRSANTDCSIGHSSGVGVWPKSVPKGRLWLIKWRPAHASSKSFLTLWIMTLSLVTVCSAKQQQEPLCKYDNTYCVMIQTPWRRFSFEISALWSVLGHTLLVRISLLWVTCGLMNEFSKPVSHFKMCSCVYSSL